MWAATVWRDCVRPGLTASLWITSPGATGRPGWGYTPLCGGYFDPAVYGQVFAEHSIEAVLHFAAASQVGESMKDPLLYYENNLCATVALLRAWSA